MQRSAIKLKKEVENKISEKKLRGLGLFSLEKRRHKRDFTPLQLPERRLDQGQCWPLFSGDK